MEPVSILVAAIAVAVSAQAVLLIGVLSALLFALLFSVPPTMLGWVAEKMTPGGSGPAPGVARPSAIDLPKLGA